MTTQSHRTILVSIAVIAVVALGAAWWFSPWSAGLRYRHAGLVALWRAAQDDPKDFLAWRELGLRLARKGDPLAERPLREAHALRPSDSDVAAALGELLCVSNRYSEAFQILKSLTGTHPGYAPGRMALGRLYFRRNSPLNASKEFESVTRADPANSDAWYLLGACRLQMQQPASAASALSKALSLSPDVPEYLRLKARADAANGNVDAGLAAACRAADLAPQSAATLLDAASLLLMYHRDAGDLARAEKIIASLEARAPMLPQVLYERGELERMRGHWQAAARYLEKAAAGSPAQREIFYSLSQTYRRIGRPADADRALAVYRSRQAPHQPDTGAIPGGPLRH